MIRAICIRALRGGGAAVLAIVALAFAAGHAAAAEAALPALRAHVTVNSDLVRIGDLVANAGPVAGIPIFRAPDLGTTGTVSTEEVTAAIRPYQLIDINTGGLAEVTVTRASRIIRPREISARIARALSEQYGLGKPRDIALAFDRPMHAIAVEPDATGDLQVAALNYDPHSHRFDVTLDLSSSAVLERQPLRFTGTATATVEAVAVAHPVDRGKVLQASDLTMLHQPRGVADVITDVDDAIGLAARHTLLPGRPLNDADLMRPKIVQRNESVTLVYKVPGLRLTLRGKARQAGALGDRIDVLNPETKRVVEGVITGPGRVRVATASIHLAEATPPAPSIAEPPPRNE